MAVTRKDGVAGGNFGCGSCSSSLCGHGKPLVEQIWSDPADSRPFAVIGLLLSVATVRRTLSLCTGGFFEPGNFGSDPQARCLDGEMDIARVGESYCASAHGHENRVPALTRDSRSCE